MIYNTIYNQKITILNKLRHEDIGTQKDVWYKTVLNNAAVYTNSKMDANGTSAEISNYKIALIPFSDNYEAYRDWKSNDSRDLKYTMSLGDYIVRGNVTEDITADNIIKTLKNYGEDVCQVKHFKELYQRFGAYTQLEIEGV